MEFFSVFEGIPMKSNICISLFAVLLSLLLFLSGCMTYGREFNFQNIDKLVLGETQKAEYENLFGKPITVDSRKDPESEFETVSYAYGAANFSTGRIRTLLMEYKNGVLNAYRYISSFQEDRTLADVPLFDQIEIGQKKEDVERLLGKPSGKALCPTLLEIYSEHCNFGKEVWSWNSVSEVIAGKSPEIIVIYVIFDREGAVVNTLRRKLQG